MGFIRIMRFLISVILAMCLISGLISCGRGGDHSKGSPDPAEASDSEDADLTSDNTLLFTAILVLPENPKPGEPFRILLTGTKNILKSRINVYGRSGILNAGASRAGGESPFWRTEEYPGAGVGRYKVSLQSGKNKGDSLIFEIKSHQAYESANRIWKTRQGWNGKMEGLYAVWVNALFEGCNEGSSWSALHELTQNKERNFLYNYLSLGEDDPENKNHVVMEPDCADNPFFLRAYFAWKLGLPFGYHLCDRGYPGRNPSCGQWITNESYSSQRNQILAFNDFLRNIMNGVHSGTARTALDNENSDYYPVPLERPALRPGTVFADPYGHTMILIRWIMQSKNQPGSLLSVDAQPDGTIAIKRFWRGNFLFNTHEVIGEPGFKAFRPIVSVESGLQMVKNKELIATSGFVPFSLQQKNMESEDFYHSMDRLINPKPLDPETALNDLIRALHEQLLVRVNSVANGEAYFKAHPGSVIPMPSNAQGIFLTGGVWENFSTPNRDLRLLIAMDAVLGFAERANKYPEDFNIPKRSSAEQVKKKLQHLLDQRTKELSITYTRSDGSEYTLTLAEILQRREAFEMGYNPNDGVEIRWGAPENSRERSTCRRHAPASQHQTMQKVRVWFRKRLHPPT